MGKRAGMLVWLSTAALLGCGTSRARAPGPAPSGPQPAVVLPHAANDEATVRGTLADAARECAARLRAEDGWQGDIVLSFVVVVESNGAAADVKTVGLDPARMCLEAAARRLDYGVVIGGVRAIVSGAYSFKGIADAGGVDTVDTTRDDAGAGAADAGPRGLASNAEMTVRTALAAVAKACYEELLATQAWGPEVKIAIVIKVGPDGFPVDARAEGHPFVGACIARTARVLNYGAVRGGRTATVSASFDFIPRQKQ